MGAPTPATADPAVLEEYEELTGRPKPAPDIPEAVRPLLREATRERIVVESLAGAPIEVDISWMEPQSFDTFHDGRFVGFEFIGYEAFGYVLVDRRMAGEGAMFETGARPLFSPAGDLFAAVDLSVSGYGNLNGLAVWRIGARGTERIFFDESLPEGFEWTLDGWRGETCILASYVPFEWAPPEGESWEEAIARAPRTRLAVRLDGAAPQVAQSCGR